MEKIIQPVRSSEEIKQDIEPNNGPVAQAQPSQSSTNFSQAQPQPATYQPAQSATPAVEPSNVATTQPTPNYVAASQMAPAKRAIPKGIYVVVGLNVLGVASSFVGSHPSYTIVTAVLSLLLCLGLLLGVDVIRKIFIGISILTVVLYAVALLGVVGLEHKLDQTMGKFETAASEVKASHTVSSSDKQKIAKLKIETEQKYSQAEHNFTIMILGIAFVGAYTIGEIIYLTRPRVSQFFLEENTARL